jgi:hypothetical protein
MTKRVLRSKLKSYVGRPVSELTASLPSEYAVLCHLWPLPQGWPEHLIGKYGKRRIHYMFEVRGRLYSAIIDPMNLSHGRFVAVLYRRSSKKPFQNYVPIAFLNVAADTVIRHVWLVSKGFVRSTVRQSLERERCSREFRSLQPDVSRQLKGIPTAQRI